MGLSARDILLLSPELSLVVAALLVVVSDLAMRRRGTALVLALAGIAVPFLLSIWLWYQVRANGAEMGFNGSLAVDEFALYFKFLILGTLALVLLASRDALGRMRYQAEFIGLVMLSATGLMLLAAAADLITMFVALELASLPVVALAAFVRGSARGIEAGFKYLLLSAISSAVLLYGFAFLYGATGTVRVVALDPAVPTIASMVGTLDPAVPFGSVALMLGAILAIGGFGFKLSVVPFHMWTPDVYEGAPTPVGAFLSVASKAAAFAVVLRLFYTALGHELVSADWSVLFAGLAAVTMTAGNLMAITQTNFKRLLGYSTIAQAGYMLVGVAAIAARSQEPGDAVLGPSSVLFYLVGYAAMNLAAFFVAMVVIDRTSDERIEGLAGLGRTAPFLAGVLALAALSLTGIPPTVGFMGKFFLFDAAINAGMAWLAVVGVVNSAVSAYYYLNIIKTMYLREPGGREPGGRDPERDVAESGATGIRIGAAPTVALAVTGAGVLVFGLWPGGLLDLARSAAAGLV